MFCENYRESLLNVAAGGGPLAPEAERHLASCESCRSAFNEEKALMAAMDSGLRDLMSKEPCASLATRVRADIAREPARQRRFRLVWVWVPAAAMATLLLAVFSPRVFEDFHPGSGPVISVAPGPAVRSAGEKNPSSQPGRSPSVARVGQIYRARRTLLAVVRQPEVLVPRGQEAALVNYVALSQKKPGLARAQAEDRSKESLVIEPLQITQLSAQPLAIEPLVSEAPDSSR